MISYYRSARADKASDYEDIWEKSPVPEVDLPDQPGLPPLISPTISEQRFKQFLFNKVFDKSTDCVSDGQLEAETDINEDDDDLLAPSDPSYPTCSSSENISSSDIELCASSSISSYSTDSSDICDDLENTEDLTDPLAALENLTNYDTEDDLDDCFDDCDTNIESSDVNNADTLPIVNSNDTVEKKKAIISNATSEESVEKEALSNNSINDEQSCKLSTSGSLTGLLRKLSIHRKPSFTRSWSRSRPAEKRLSAVIGCYLTPDLLGLTNEECQVDSSSWEFLDQSKQPGLEYFLQSGVRQRTPSPAKPDISDDSTLDSLYHSDESDQHHESSDQRDEHTRALSPSRVSGSIRGSVARPESERCTSVTPAQCNVRVNDAETQKQESLTPVTHIQSHPSASNSLCNSLSDLVTKNSSVSSVAESGHSSVTADSAESAPAKKSPQKSATLTERHPRCGHTGAGAAVIKSYLRQLSSSETSVLGQIVR